MNIALVVAEFNSEVTAPMEIRARERAAELGAAITRVIKVPGVYDMGPIVKALLRLSDVDGVVMIGAVITGETKHDELIAHAIAQAAMNLSIEFEKPVGLAITGPGMNDDQAQARIGNAANGITAVVSVARELAALRR
jgi:6,7-dimethyl-8-ribityllumazine synthase